MIDEKKAKFFNRDDYPRPMHKTLYSRLLGEGYVCPRCKQSFHVGDIYTRKRITNSIPRNGNIFHSRCIVDAHGEPIY